MEGFKKEEHKEVEPSEAGVEDSQAGWGDKTREQILVERKNERMGEFHPENDIGYAALAQQEIEMIEQKLEDLQTQGQEDNEEWQRQEKNKEHYTKMLELTPPEARPTQKDNQLESELQKIRNEYNDKILELGFTQQEINRLREKVEIPKELIDLDTQIKMLQQRQESAKAHKILDVAYAMDIPSADHLMEKFKTGDVVYTKNWSKTPEHEFSGWRINYLTDVSGTGSGYNAILQRGEGDHAELRIWPIDDVERWKTRQEVEALEE
jgi:hypothetical protein